jgi:Zn-dependent metalloprotease
MTHNVFKEVVHLRHQLLKTVFAVVGLVSAGCVATDEQQAEIDDAVMLASRDGTDIQQALSALPGAMVLGTHEKDAVPYLVQGNFGRATGPATGLAAVDAKATVQSALSQLTPVFGLRTEDLVFKRVSVDSNGQQHLHFSQLKNHLPVVNGELILHLDKDGTVFAVNGDARDVQGTGSQAVSEPRISAGAAEVAARGATQALDTAARAERLVYVRDSAGELVLAHEVRVTGSQVDSTPVEDWVYINAANGEEALRAPKVYTALNRAVYSANNGTSLPGTLRRSEGGAATGDTHVDTNYLRLGGTYSCYSVNFGRDSYNNAGAQMRSTVHYNTNYVGAFWNGTQLVYGDGDGVNSLPLGLDNDVTTHELTHAVTANESNLTYAGEPGCLNESMSDIFTAICESWESGTWSTAADIWKVGEDVWTPGIAGDALRYMDDPAFDGTSLDWYPDYTPNMDVHYCSGLSNLAFALLVKGGSHPRGKSPIVVPGVGMQIASQIWYKANTDLMTSSTTFAQAKTYTEQAAVQLGYSQAIVDSVSLAWQAVGVGITIPPPVSTPLTNGVALTGQSGSTGAKAYYKLTVPSGQGSLVFEQSGGTGDADLYVKLGSAPTSTSYNCRPYLSGNAETCTFTNPAAGDWYVMINGYSTYSGVSIKGTYSTALTNGVATAPYSGAAGSMTCWTLNVPAGKTSVVFNQAGATGNTGDADLYVQYNAAPTTSTYNCRPYLSGNVETCTISNPAAGTWYACSRGYTAYTNVTMKGTY